MSSNKTDLRMMTRERRQRDIKLRPRRDSRCGKQSLISRRRSYRTILILRFKVQEERLLKVSNLSIKKTKDRDFWDFKKEDLPMKKLRLNVMNSLEKLQSNSDQERVTLSITKSIKWSMHMMLESQSFRIQTMIICTWLVLTNCHALWSRITLLLESEVALINWMTMWCTTTELLRKS